MNIVDKLTPNSETVVNTEEEKKNILNVAHLVTKSCKKRKEKKLTIKTVMHRGFSIQNCTFQLCSTGFKNSFFSFFYCM